MGEFAPAEVGPEVANMDGSGRLGEIVAEGLDGLDGLEKL